MARGQHDTGLLDSASRIALHPGGTLVALANRRGPVRVWDLEHRAVVWTLPLPRDGCFDLAFRPDGKQLALAGKDGIVRLWNTETRQPEGPPLTASANPYCLAYSADGRLLALGTKENSVYVWTVATHQENGVVRLGSPVMGDCLQPWTADARWYAAVRTTPIRLLDSARLQEVAELRGHRDYVHAVHFSPDGTRIVSESWRHHGPPLGCGPCPEPGRVRPALVVVACLIESRRAPS